MGSNGSRGHRPPPKVSAHTHKPKEKRGNPRRGFPLKPPPALKEHKRLPRSAERGQGRCPWTLPPLKRWTKLSNAQCAKNQHQPLPQVGRGTSRPPTCSAHANGGAARVKKRFSLAARHRFFGQAPKKWGRIAAGAIDHNPKYRRTRTKRRKEKGEPPARVPP